MKAEASTVLKTNHFFSSEPPSYDWLAKWSNLR